MKPYYWESQHGNFGDDLNLWLWDFLLPGFRDAHPDTLLVGVGTVLNTALLPEEGRKLVIGSGYGYGTIPDMRDHERWDVRCVRGPLTAERAGVSPDMGIVDPAVMVAEMPEFKGLAKRHRKSFVPHWETALAGVWPAICERVGLHYIDPRGEARSVIREIAQSETVIAESMHGAILSDAFRVPWVAVSTSRSINSFKWNDWARTVGVRYAPRRIPVSTRAEAKLKGGRFWGMAFQGEQTASVGDPNSRIIGEDVLVAASNPRQTTLRVAAKHALALPSTVALWQASRDEPQLSSDSVLFDRKARLLAVLDGVRRDYL